MPSLYKRRRKEGRLGLEEIERMAQSRAAMRAMLDAVDLDDPKAWESPYRFVRKSRAELEEIYGFDPTSDGSVRFEDPFNDR